MSRIKTQLPFQLFFSFIKQQDQRAKASAQLVGQMNELDLQR